MFPQPHGIPFGLQVVPILVLLPLLLTLLLVVLLLFTIAIDIANTTATATAPTAAIGAAAAARLLLLLVLLLLLATTTAGCMVQGSYHWGGAFVDTQHVNIYLIGASCFFTNLSTARLCQTAVEHRGTNDESTSFALDVQCNQECALNMVDDRFQIPMLKRHATT